MGNGSKAGSGYTFVEVLVAIMVLGIIATSMASPLTSANPQKLELAASEVAAAVRFARSEAMRTGAVHSVLVDEVNGSVAVEVTDLVAKPAAAESIAYHPIAKQPYQLALRSNPSTSEVAIDNSDPAFQFAAVGKKQRVMFTGDGLPVYIDTVANTTNLLQDGTIDLVLEELNRAVIVHPFTGRVTIQ